MSQGLQVVDLTECPQCGTFAQTRWYGRAASWHPLMLCELWVPHLTPAGTPCTSEIMYEVVMGSQPDGQ